MTFDPYDLAKRQWGAQEKTAEQRLDIAKEGLRIKVGMKNQALQREQLDLSKRRADITREQFEFQKAKDARANDPALQAKAREDQLKFIKDQAQAQADVWFENSKRMAALSPQSKRVTDTPEQEWLKEVQKTYRSNLASMQNKNGGSIAPEDEKKFAANALRTALLAHPNRPPSITDDGLAEFFKLGPPQSASGGILRPPKERGIVGTATGTLGELASWAMGTAADAADKLADTIWPEDPGEVAGPATESGSRLARAIWGAAGKVARGLGRGVTDMVGGIAPVSDLGERNVTAYGPAALKAAKKHGKILEGTFDPGAELKKIRRDLYTEAVNGDFGDRANALAENLHTILALPYEAVVGSAVDVVFGAGAVAGALSTAAEGAIDFNSQQFLAGITEVFDTVGMLAQEGDPRAMEIARKITSTDYSEQESLIAGLTKFMYGIHDSVFETFGMPSLVDRHGMPTNVAFIAADLAAIYAYAKRPMPQYGPDFDPNLAGAHAIGPIHDSSKAGIGQQYGPVHDSAQAGVGYQYGPSYDPDLAGVGSVHGPAFDPDKAGIKGRAAPNIFEQFNAGNPNQKLGLALDHNEAATKTVMDYYKRPTTQGKYTDAAAYFADFSADLEKVMNGEKFTLPNGVEVGQFRQKIKVGTSNTTKKKTVNPSKPIEPTPVTPANVAASAANVSKSASNNNVKAAFKEKLEAEIANVNLGGKDVGFYETYVAPVGKALHALGDPLVSRLVRVAEESRAFKRDVAGSIHKQVNRFLDQTHGGVHISGGMWKQFIETMHDHRKSGDFQTVLADPRIANSPHLTALALDWRVLADELHKNFLEPMGVEKKEVYFPHRPVRHPLFDIFGSDRIAAHMSEPGHARSQGGGYRIEMDPRKILHSYVEDIVQKGAIDRVTPAMEVLQRIAGDLKGNQKNIKSLMNNFADAHLGKSPGGKDILAELANNVSLKLEETMPYGNRQAAAEIRSGLSDIGEMYTLAKKAMGNEDTFFRAVEKYRRDLAEYKKGLKPKAPSPPKGWAEVEKYRHQINNRLADVNEAVKKTNWALPIKEVFGEAPGKTVFSRAMQAFYTHALGGKFLRTGLMQAMDPVSAVPLSLGLKNAVLNTPSALKYGVKSFSKLAADVGSAAIDGLKKHDSLAWDVSIMRDAIKEAISESPAAKPGQMFPDVMESIGRKIDIHFDDPQLVGKHPLARHTGDTKLGKAASWAGGAVDATSKFLMAAYEYGDKFIAEVPARMADKVFQQHFNEAKFSGNWNAFIDKIGPGLKRYPGLRKMIVNDLESGNYLRARNDFAMWMAEESIVAHGFASKSGGILSGVNATRGTVVGSAMLQMNTLFTRHMFDRFDIIKREAGLAASDAAKLDPEVMMRFMRIAVPMLVATAIVDGFIGEEAAEAEREKNFMGIGLGAQWSFGGATVELMERMLNPVHSYPRKKGKDQSSFDFLLDSLYDASIGMTPGLSQMKTIEDRVATGMAFTNVSHSQKKPKSVREGRKKRKSQDKARAALRAGMED